MYVSFTYINFKAKIVTKYSSKKNILWIEIVCVK
jgi:hypothetical protein